MAQIEFVVEPTNVSLNDLLAAFSTEVVGDTTDSDDANQHEFDPAGVVVESALPEGKEEEKEILDQQEPQLVQQQEETPPAPQRVHVRIRQAEKPCVQIKEPRAEEPVTHNQLYRLFDSFFDRLKQEQLVLEKPQTETQNIQLKVSDRTDEIEELKALLIEAQETIIKLLTDRVEDRSKIAMLEAQLKYLPLQQYADSQTRQLRKEQDSLHQDLLQVKSALKESSGRNKLRAAAEPRPGIFAGLKGLFAR